MTQENLTDDESDGAEATGTADGARDAPLAERGERALSDDSEGLEAPVRVSWRREADGGTTVWVRYYEGDQRPYWAVECMLGPNNRSATFPYPPGGSEGTLELTLEDREHELRGNLPLNSTNWFNGLIARWQPWPSTSVSSEAQGQQPPREVKAPPEEEAPPEEVSAGTEDVMLTTAPPAMHLVDGAQGDPAGPEGAALASVPAAMQVADRVSRATAPGPETAEAPRRDAAPCPSGWRRGGTIIDNPARPLELFRCLWLRRPQTPVVRAFGLGFVFLENPESLPFYNELAALRVESDGRDQMMEAARAFAETEVYVGRITELDTPVVAYPELVEKILEIEGVVPLATVLEPVNTFLFAYGVGPLESYLESPYLEEVEARVWQTLFAVALGAWDDPRLGDRLVGVLRVDHFLRQLWRELLAPQQPLTTPVGRRTALQASVVLAEGAVPLAPGCTCDPPPSDQGWVRALGIGDLKRVFQCLLGYQPGEVAWVVNVMARERLELSARERLQHRETSASHQTRIAEEDTDREQTSRSDLRQEIGDLIANEALCSHYDDLSQKYESQTITLDGTWTGKDRLRERTDREARDYAQSLTRRAASRIVDAVAETRIHQRLEEHERLSARDVDNRQGTERLVGIYRWIKKLYRMTLEDAGKRLVVELEIADPARDFLRHVRHKHGILLEPPPPLAREGVSGPGDVTRENYLVLASLYDVEDPEPPPPEQLVRVRSLQAQPPVSEAELAVPAGYEVKDAEVSYLLGDGSDSLVGYVGDAPFAYPETTSPPALVPVAEAAESAAEPAEPVAEADDTGCPECDPIPTRTPESPVQGLIPLSDLTGQTDTTFSVTVLSTASSFFASVTLTCELLAASGLFEAWQVRTYDALVAGFNRSRALFLARLRARITASSAGRERQIERRQLERASVASLASLRAGGGEPSPPCSPPHGRSETRDLELFDHAFDWAEMTYAFHPWPPPEEPCGRNPYWRGEAVIDLEADELFKSFLHAHSARVLVPVIPGAELEVLYYLLFGLLWPGDAHDVPVAAVDVALVADLRAPPEVDVAPSWCLEIPTSLRILQADDELPVFECPLGGEPTVAGRQLETPESEPANGEAEEPATERS